MTVAMANLHTTVMMATHIQLLPRQHLSQIAPTTSHMAHTTTITTKVTAVATETSTTPITQAQISNS